MKKVTKAARFLSQFDMKNIYYGTFSVYSSRKGLQLEGVGGTYGRDLRGIIGYKDFLKWDTQKFQDFIEHTGVFIKKSPEEREVVCVRVCFGMNDGDEELYILECTDFTTMNHFNRLIIERSYGRSVEMYLTPKESRKLHGTADVIKLCRRMPAERLVDFKTDLPIVVGNGFCTPFRRRTRLGNVMVAGG